MLRSRSASAPSSSDDIEGAAAVEFALIVPLLIVLFFGIFQVGIAVFRAQVTEAIAREAARVAAVGATADEIRAAGWDASTGFTTGPGGEVRFPTIETCDSRTGNAVVEVRVSGPRLNFEIPFVGSYTPNFEARSVFECERGPNG